MLKKGLGPYSDAVQSISGMYCYAGGDVDKTLCSEENRFESTETFYEFDITSCFILKM